MSELLEQYAKIFRFIRKYPTFLLTFAVMYVSVAGAFYLYQMEKSRTVKLDSDLDRLNNRVKFLEAERQLWFETVRTSDKNLDIFKRLSFAEKASSNDQPKLHAAQSLNSFAKYALDNRDLKKARDSLEESLGTYPTMEAKYYLGIIDYLEGHNQGALANWTSIITSKEVPSDIFVYLALAEYRDGNIEASKKYADAYARLQ